MNFVRLGDVCQFTSGGTPSRSVVSYFQGDIPWITGADITGPVAYAARSYISPEALDKSAASLAAKGTVLLVTRTSVGKVAVAGRDIAFSQDITAVRPRTDVTCASYITQMLRVHQPTLELQARGATIKGVTRRDVESLEIPLPSLDEQRRIAAILDKADELRTKRRQALAHLDTLTQSIFHSMFGEPMVATNQRVLMELLASIDSGSSPVSADRPADEGEWGILKLSAVTSQTFIETENKALLATAPDVRHEVRAGDVLFTRKNTPNLVAAVAMVRRTRRKLLLPDLIFRLNIADRQTLEPEYLHAVMSYPTKRASIQRLAGGAAASMSNISKTKLLTVPVPVPPLVHQQTFATRVTAVERLKESHRKHLAELDTLFASLQYRAFKGEL